MMNVQPRQNTLFVLSAACVVLTLAYGCHRPARQPAESMPRRGKVFLLPGVSNISLEMKGLANRVRTQSEWLDVQICVWGKPLQSLRNLRAHDENRAAAQRLADEIAAYRRCEPSGVIDLVGFSGGGGLAVFVVEALPPEVSINRLILIAPAIAPDYPVLEQVLPHVSEFAINYASRLDETVGWGTRLMGTMDRSKADSAGHVGFVEQDPRLLQVFWKPQMMKSLHWGTHLSYLSPFWQRHYLLPALDHRLTAADVSEVVGSPPAPEVVTPEGETTGGEHP